MGASNKLKAVKQLFGQGEASLDQDRADKLIAGTGVSFQPMIVGLGHTHEAVFRSLPNGGVHFNTNTWTPKYEYSGNHIISANERRVGPFFPVVRVVRHGRGNNNPATGVDVWTHGSISGEKIVNTNQLKARVNYVRVR